MNTYSIEKVGSDYIVKVDNISVMKMASRRRAAQLVAEAAGLLEEVFMASVAATREPASESSARQIGPVAAADSAG